MLRLKLSEQQARDLQSIGGAGSDALEKTYGELVGLKSSLSSPKELKALFEGSLGDDVGEALTRQLFGLTSLSRGSGADASEVLEAVRAAMTDDKRYQPENLRAWDTVVPQFQKLLRHDRVQVTAKALELAFSYQTIFTKAEILIDLRPVFDTNHDLVLGMLLSFKLRLFMSTDSGPESLTITMDERDVQRLLKSCDEALKKVRKAKAFIETKCDVETFVVGENFYE